MYGELLRIFTNHGEGGGGGGGGGGRGQCVDGKYCRVERGSKERGRAGKKWSEGGAFQSEEMRGDHLGTLNPVSWRVASEFLNQEQEMKNRFRFMCGLTLRKICENSQENYVFRLVKISLHYTV